MVIKMMVIIVLKKVVLHQKRKPLLQNVVVRRRMTVTVMKTGKEPKRVQRKLAVYVFFFNIYKIGILFYIYISII